MVQHAERSYPLSLYPGPRDNASASNYSGDENVQFLVSFVSF
jgi:hypothetical protein